METLQKIKKLSFRQKQIFFLFFTALRQSEIAWKLKIDPRTLDTHALCIYKKFEVNSRIGLILSVLVETKGVIPVTGD